MRRTRSASRFLALLLPLALAGLLLPIPRAARGASPAEPPPGEKPATRYHLRVLVLPSLREAENALKRLGKGTPFPQIVREKSIGPSKDKGGYIGAVEIGKMRPEVFEKTSRLKIGEISGIIESEGRFSIFQRTTDEHFRRGMAALRKNRPADAIPPLERDVALNPDNFSGWLALGDAHRALNELKEADAAYRGAIRLAPTSPKPYNNLANLYAQNGQIDAAIILLRQALKYNPRHEVLLRNLVILLTRRKNTSDEALAKSRLLLSVQPASSENYNLLAWVHEQRGDRKSAIAAMRQAVRLDPENLDYREKLDEYETAPPPSASEVPKNGKTGARIRKAEGHGDTLSSERPPRPAPGRDVMTSLPEPPAPPAPARPAATRIEKSVRGIQVLNGNGVRGSAGRWARHLRGLGLNVRRVGNARQRKYRKTIFYYRPGAEKLALRVRQIFQRRVRLKKQDARLARRGYDLIIVLGRTHPRPPR